MNFSYLLIIFLLLSCSSTHTFRKISSSENNLKIAQNLFEKALIEKNLYKLLHKDMTVYHWRTRTDSGILPNSKNRKKNKKLLKEYITWTTDHFWGEDIVDFAGFAAMGPGLYTTFNPFTSSKFALGTQNAHNYSHQYSQEDLKTGLLVEILIPKNTPYLDIQRDVYKINSIAGVFDDEAKESFSKLECFINENQMWGQLIHNDPACRKIAMPVLKKLEIQFMPHQWSHSNVNSFDFEEKCIDMNIAILLISSKNISTENINSYVYEDFQEEKLDPKLRFLLKSAPEDPTHRVDAMVIQNWAENISKEANNKFVESNNLAAYRKWVNSHPHCGEIIGHVRK